MPKHKPQQRWIESLCIFSQNVCRNYTLTKSILVMKKDQLPFSVTTNTKPFSSLSASTGSVILGLNLVVIYLGDIYNYEQSPVVFTWEEELIATTASRRGLGLLPIS
jgi:hypothetical protein